MGTVSIVEYVLGLLATVTMAYLTYSVYFRKGFAEHYVRTSPEAYIWRKMFGVEKTILLSRWVFAPLGIMVLFAYFYMTRILPAYDEPRYDAGAHHFPQAPLEESLALFERMGFFESIHGRTLEEKVAYIQEQPLFAYVRDGYTRDGLVDEPVVLAFDSERVWWSDTERGVATGADMYPEILYELSYISLGYFTPIDVTETWAGPEGPITVIVECEDGTVTLSPEYLEDYVDVGILGPINEHIASSGYAYYMYEPFDQTALVFFLSEAEAAALTERGWQLTK